MCQQRNIKAINHTNTIDPAKHLNESKFHLNKYGTIKFDQYNWNFPNFVRNTFLSDHSENLNENGSEESILVSEYNNNNDNKNLIGNLTDIRSVNPSKVLNDIP